MSYFNNVLDAFEKLYDAAAGALKVTLVGGDIEIGSVELKDSDSVAQANIKAASTARTAATVVLATQDVDASGVVGAVQGGKADNAADAGNPIKVGGKYNAAAPTYSDGDRCDDQHDVNGNKKVTLATSLDKTNDSITSYLATDLMMNGATSLTPKFAKIELSATGTVVAAVSSKKIRVLGFFFVSAGTVNVNFQSHTTTATKTGLSYLVANSGVSSGFFPVGLFETVAGEALDLALSAEIAVGGQVVYIEV